MLTAKCQSKLSLALNAECWMLAGGSWILAAGSRMLWSGSQWCAVDGQGQNVWPCQLDWTRARTLSEVLRNSGCTKLFQRFAFILSAVQSAGDICFDVLTWLTCGCRCFSTGNVSEQLAGLIKLANQTHITSARRRQMTCAHSGCKQFSPTILVWFNQPNELLSGLPSCHS